VDPAGSHRNTQCHKHLNLHAFCGTHRNVPEPRLAACLTASQTSVRPGDIGNTLYRRDRLHIRSERVVDGLQGSLLEVNVSEVIVHEGDEPDSVIDLLDSDPLTGEHG
jgi:hypothetical protein